MVGRLTEDPQLLEMEQNQARMVVTLAVQRTFRNPEGFYETDFLRCILWNGIAKRTKEYCKRGDLVCVRGRIQVRSFEDLQAQKKYMTEIIVESIAFLQSASRKEKIESFVEEDSNSIKN